MPCGLWITAGLVGPGCHGAGVDHEYLRRLARRQFGVFTRSQARAYGYSEYQVRRRLNAGEWQVVLGSALSLGGLAVTPSIRDRAAQLSVPGSVLGGPSAARTWRLPVPDPTPCLYVGRNGRSGFAGVRLIRDMPEVRDVSLYQGLPTTSRSLAVIDCLRFLPDPAALSLLERALQRGWLDLDELTARVHARAGRGDRAKLIRLHSQVRGGERSEAERRLTGLLRAAGITGWQVNGAVCDDQGLIGVADVLFRRARLVIEVDGWAYHSTPDRFQRDRERQNRLVAAGWTVLRFTWRDLTDHPERVVATLRRVM
jgi:very-short-patch-repair endonuclease